MKKPSQSLLYSIHNLARMFGFQSAFGSELSSLFENHSKGRTTYKSAQQRFRLFAKIYSRRMAK